MGEKASGRDTAKNATSRTVGYIRKNIESGSWPVGSKIPSENELCQELGVSRISVRSALSQFIALRILKSEHGKGTFVISNNLDVMGNTSHALPTAYRDIRQLLQFRQMIEPAIARLAAENADDALIKQLDELFKKMLESVGDTNQFVSYDMQFHVALCSATKNEIAVSVMSNIFQSNQEVHHRLNSAVGYYGGIYYHSLILEAVRKHNGAKAEQLMREHLQKSIDELSDEDTEET